MLKRQVIQPKGRDRVHFHRELLSVRVTASNRMFQHSSGTCGSHDSVAIAGTSGLEPTMHATLALLALALSTSAALLTSFSVSHFQVSHFQGSAPP
jgi:hypothetical protein